MQVNSNEVGDREAMEMRNIAAVEAVRISEDDTNVGGDQQLLDRIRVPEEVMDYDNLSDMLLLEGFEKDDDQQSKPHAIARIPEEDFLRILLQQQDVEVMRMMVEHRLAYISKNNFAERMKRMPFWQVALSRYPAIIVTLMIELVVGLVIDSNKALVQKYVMMASFLPILSSMSGNMGLQASTTTLRALSTGHASTDSASVLGILLKEFFASLVVASVSGCAVWLIAWSWADSFRFGIVTGLGIFLNSCVAGIMGSMGPLVFRSLKIDPALSAGPFETALQDLIGTSIYFALASWILSVN